MSADVSSGASSVNVSLVSLAHMSSACDSSRRTTSSLIRAWEGPRLRFHVWGYMAFGSSKECLHVLDGLIHQVVQGDSFGQTVVLGLLEFGMFH